MKPDASIHIYKIITLPIILLYFCIHRKGGKRRLIIPAKLGYTNKNQCPIPADFGQQQRLYSTVLNDVRGTREKEALGDSLAGIVVLDVEVVKIYPPKSK